MSLASLRKSKLPDPLCFSVLMATLVEVGLIESYVGLGAKTQVGAEAPLIKASLWFLILFTLLVPNLLLVRVAF